MGLKITETPIAGLHVIDTAAIADRRGSFDRVFCLRELQPVFGDRAIVQINHSRTVKPGAVRGLHFQRAPHAEMKCVRCLRGRVWDVAVDLRKGSPTFLYYHAVELSAENARMVMIPEGFAHGFQAILPESELLYLHTAFYEPASEGGVHHADPRIGIDWPYPVSDLSERDAGHPLLSPDFKGL